MAKIYISATFSDLEAHRQAAANAIARIKHHIIGMEAYVPTGERSLDVCYRDVADCDYYVGLFAWRYGHVPKSHDPSNETSITELEYRKAVELGKPRLIFLLSDSAPWPPPAMDAVTGEGDAGKKIKLFREELKNELLCGTFRSPEELASLVVPSIYLAETSILIQGVFAEGLGGAPNEMLDASGHPEIAARVRQAMHELEEPDIDLPLSADIGPAARLMALKSAAEHSQVLEINLKEGNFWWSTRLHLLAALVADYTRVRQLLFLDSSRRFIGMASPVATRRALAAAHPEVEILYREALRESRKNGVDELQAQIEFVVQHVAARMYGVYPGGEQQLKSLVDASFLKHWLGQEFSSYAFDIAGASMGPQVLYQMIAQANPVVVIVKNQKLERVFDRSGLATRIALGALEQRM